MASFIAQGFNGIEPGGLAGGIKTEENTDRKTHAEGKKDRTGGNDGVKIGEDRDQQSAREPGETVRVEVATEKYVDRVRADTKRF